MGKIFICNVDLAPWACLFTKTDVDMHFISPVLKFNYGLLLLFLKYIYIYNGITWKIGNRRTQKIAVLQTSLKLWFQKYPSELASAGGAQRRRDWKVVETGRRIFANPVLGGEVGPTTSSCLAPWVLPPPQVQPRASLVTPAPLVLVKGSHTQ